MASPGWAYDTSPPSGHTQQQQHATIDASLRSLVYYYLDCYMFPNATFLCERLVACDPREENVLLLAVCHVREASALRAHALLQGCRLPQSRYLLAYCCVHLGKLDEAERVLLAGTKIMQKGPKDCRDEILADSCPIPNGAAGLRLLGLACQRLGRRESAEEYFRLSLELDPLLWVSVASLCELGVDFDVKAHFRKDVKKIATAAALSAKGSYYSYFGPDAVSGRPIGSTAGWGGGGCTDCPTCALRKTSFAGAQGMPGSAMPPPPPRTPAAAGLRYDGTPGRFGETETKEGDPVRGALFGTPTPAQPPPQAVKAAAAGGGGASAFNTPGYMTPAVQSMRAAVPDVPAAGTSKVGDAGDGSKAWAETAGKSVGHLLDLGTRLGTFFPPAEGPGGRPPGVNALFAGAARALDTVRHDPPAPWYDASKSCILAGDVSSMHQDGKAEEQESKHAQGEGIGVEQAGVDVGMGGGGRVGAHLFATPGLTPIHPAQQTPDQTRRPAGDDAYTRNESVATPSMFLSGLLRGSPDTAAITDAAARLETLQTPAHDDAGGVRLTSLSGLLSVGATGGGATRLAAAGLGTSAVGEGGGGNGAGGGVATTSRPSRGGGGGRRVGGRLSFSSAVGTEDGSGGDGSEGGVRGGGEGSSTEERSNRAASRPHASRQSRAGPTSTTTAARIRKTAGAAGRTGTRPPSMGVTGAGGAAGAGTPASANLAGRASRSSTAAAAAAAAGAAAARRGAGAGAGATPMDVETPSVDMAAGVRDSSPVVATRRRSAPGRDSEPGVGQSEARADGAEPAVRRSTRASVSRRLSGGGPRRITKSIFCTPRGTGPGSLDVYYSEDGRTEFVPKVGFKGRDYSACAAGYSAGEGRRDGAGVSKQTAAPEVGTGRAHNDGGGESTDDDELRLTRREWECLQWDETISFALNYANSSHDIVEKPGDREALLASIAVRQAAHATHRAITASAAAAGESTLPNASVRGVGPKAPQPRAGPKGSPPAAGRGIGGKDKGGRDAAGANASARRSKHAAIKGKEGKEGGRKVLRKEGKKAIKGPWGGEVESGMQEVAALLVVLAGGYKLLNQFRCAEALKELERLPPQHYCTGWVQHQVGRAYFERSDYPKAKAALESMQRYDPHRMDGLDLLSTTLWHLKREVELSYLAQKVSEFDRTSPYTWCVVGNCFSLQKEHETALRFFQRAIQLDANMTYAYTLCGHEYVANEDFDKAVACFRMAIRIDRRHYNAWYGLGSIYHRQEKYDMAKYHFERALTINPQSSVLRVYLGMVLHANKHYMEALDMLALASKSEPSNPQASFQRAHVLMSMERYEQALMELQVVRDDVPKESAVYFLMGKVCKKLGRTDAAMRHFTIALDLHNKDKNLIKAAVDRLNEPDLDEEEKF